MSGHTRAVVLVSVACLAMGVASRGAESGEAVRAAMAARAAEAGKAGKTVMAGEDGYYFLAAELRHYAAGPFWGQDAAKAAVAAQNQDPLGAIGDFAGQCRKAGVRLILVPIPGKVAVYPDKLDAKLGEATGLEEMNGRFYDAVRKEGVEVIDLLPALRKLRAEAEAAHCRQDSHYGPAAVRVAAKAIAESVRREAWWAGWARQEARRTEQTVACRGDLAQMLGLPEAGAEKLKVEQVTLGGKAVEGDPQSPVVLMGDSHTIVYHEPINGGIAVSGAGLLDHLAAELGFAPDMTGQLGGGANASRIALARRRDNLAGKKVVVWVFGVRELTQAGQGWMRVPVVR